jgi:hypothetical protein
LCGLILATLALLGGGLAAVQLSAPATASTTYTWTPYNLSALAGGVASSGEPALLSDPQSGQLSAVISSPNDDTLVFGGDASSSVSATDVTSQASGIAGIAAPAAIKDPQTGDFVIFTYGSGGDLIAYDRSASTLKWSLANLGNGCCTAGGGDLPAVADNPAVATIASTNTLGVAADSPSGDLIYDARSAGGAWTGTDVTSATGQGIDSIPDLLSDPAGGTPLVLAEGANGDLLNFYSSSGTWAVLNVTSQYGGQTIDGNPDALVDNGLVDLFAEAPGGDLIEWSRDSGGQWTSQNLTNLAGGPTVTGLPSAVADPDGGIDVFVQGPDEHLVEFSGSSSSWSATDLTASDGASTIESSPTAAIDPQSGNLVVDATSPAGDLIELERTPVPASSLPTVTQTETQTVVSTPTPTKSASKQAVFEPVVLDWIAYAHESEIKSVKLGRLRSGEGFAIACRGMGARHLAGCPYLRRSATTKAAIVKLVKRTARTYYKVGDVLTVTVSQTGLHSQITRLTVRSDRGPLTKTTR